MILLLFKVIASFVQVINKLIAIISSKK